MKSRIPMIALAAVLVALPVVAFADDSSQPGSAKHFSLEGRELLLANLAGEIHVEGATGTAFEIDVTVHGEEAAVTRVRIETQEGDRAKLYVQYPFEDEERFVYPEMGTGSSTSIQIHRGLGANDWTSWVLPGHKGGRVEVRDAGRGTEVWADVSVKVPAGKRLEVRHGIGKIEAKELKSDLLLDSHSGPIYVRGVTGDLTVDTGSGNVTGIEIQGSLSVDTGSGRVELSQCSGDRILVDTGSGSVGADRIECKDLKIDTGSGGVEGIAVKTDSALIDTGSGAIHLALDRMGSGPFRLDTGSGGIDLRLPQDASARVTADTGSGRVHLDVANATVRHIGKTEAELIIGEGTAKVVLDAGSGSITIHQ